MTDEALSKRIKPPLRQEPVTKLQAFGLVPPVEPLHQLELEGVQAQLVSNGPVYRGQRDPCADAKSAETQPRPALDSAFDCLESGWGKPVGSTPVLPRSHTASPLEGLGPPGDGEGWWCSTPAQVLRQDSARLSGRPELPQELHGPNPRCHRPHQRKKGEKRGQRRKFTAQHTGLNREHICCNKKWQGEYALLP